jgi:hypothetical protein
VFASFLPHLFGDITNISSLPFLPAATAQECDAGGCDQIMRLLRAGRTSGCAEALARQKVTSRFLDPLPVRIRDALNGAQFDELAAVHSIIS